MFRKLILTSSVAKDAKESVEAKEVTQESKSTKIVSDEIVFRIKSDLKDALNCYKKNKKVVSYVTDRLYGEEPDIVTMRKFLKIEKISFEELSELLSTVEKMHSKVEFVQKAIDHLKKSMNVSIEWGREGIFSAIMRLEYLNRNTPIMVMNLIQHQESAKELQHAINKMFLDAKSTAAKELHEHAMEKYWESDTHWQKIFNKSEFSDVMTNAISIISDLDDMATEKNCDKIYAIHERGDVECICHLAEQLEELLKNDMLLRDNPRFKTSPFYYLRHKTDLNKSLLNIFDQLEEMYSVISEDKQPDYVPVYSPVILPSAPPPEYSDIMPECKEGEIEPAVLAPVASKMLDSKKEVIDGGVSLLQRHGTFRPAVIEREGLSERPASVLVLS